MYTIQRTIGVAGPSESMSVIERAALGGYSTSDDFADSPALACDVWPGGGLAVVANPPCSWADAVAGAVVVDFPEAVMAAVSVGWYDGRVYLSGDGTEIVRFRLEVIPGPGSGVAGAAYHTYQDLADAYPLVRDIYAAAADPAALASLGVAARLEIDNEIGAAIRKRCRYREAAYFAALEDPGVDLTTNDGRLLVRASVYKTLAMILEREPDKEAEADRYNRKADDILDGLYVGFGEASGLPDIRLGGPYFGRVTR